LTPAPFAPREADAAGARAAYYDGIGMPPAFELSMPDRRTPPAFETTAAETVQPPEAPEPPAEQQPPYDRRVEYEPPETEAWASGVPEETEAEGEEAGQPPYETDGFAAQADAQPPRRNRKRGRPGRPPQRNSCRTASAAAGAFRRGSAPLTFAIEEESVQPAEEPQTPEAIAEEPRKSLPESLLKNIYLGAPPRGSFLRRNCGYGTCLCGGCRPETW
jgi:hypothetical protein